jgi:hypothetical protein
MDDAEVFAACGRLRRELAGADLVDAVGGPAPS